MRHGSNGGSRNEANRDHNGYQVVVTESVSPVTESLKKEVEEEEARKWDKEEER